MPHDPARYSFRPVTRADYPMLRGWLSQSHVAATWGPPNAEIAPVEAEIDGGDCLMNIVQIDGADAGFIQNRCPHLAAVPHVADAPFGTRAIDTLHGARFTGQGHARAYVCRYAENLPYRGARRVVSDPRLTNPRGNAMYTAAGFSAGLVRTTEDGAEVRCMRFRRH